MFWRRPLTLEHNQKPNGPGRNKANYFAVRKQLLPVPANNKRRAVHRNCEEKIGSSIIPTERQITQLRAGQTCRRLIFREAMVKIACQQGSQPVATAA